MTNVEPKDAWIALDDKGEVGVTCVVVKDRILLTNRFNRIELTLEQFRELCEWLEWRYDQTLK